MFLKKQEKDNKIKVIYKSSTICASIFESDTKALTVIFNNGGQYKYADVSNSDYVRFEGGDSQGSILNTHIKKYSFTKMDKVDVTDILKEIEEMSDKTVSLDEATKTMLQSTIFLISVYVGNGEIANSALTKLEADIAVYKKALSKPKQILA